MINKTVSIPIHIPEKQDVVDFSRKAAGFVLISISQGLKVAADVTGNAARKLLAIEAETKKEEK